MNIACRSKIVYYFSGDDMELKELVTVYRSKNNLSLEEVGDAVGVSKSTVSRWESGIIKKISLEKQMLLSDLFDINVPDFLDYYFLKPILGTVKAGYNMIVNQDILGYEEVSKHEYDNGDYFLRVKGDSMTGSRIHDGDLVYIKQTQEVENGSIAVVIINDEEVTIKKVIFKDALIILEATNSSYETKYFTREDLETGFIKIIGKVLKSVVYF